VGIERTTETNTEGEYEVPALPPGSYEVSSPETGIRSPSGERRRPASQPEHAPEFQPECRSVSSVVVTVESTVPVIDSTTMTVGQVIDKNVVQEIPLNGRHFVDLALLVPGTVTPPQRRVPDSSLAAGKGSFAFNSAGGPRRCGELHDKRRQFE